MQNSKMQNFCKYSVLGFYLLVQILVICTLVVQNFNLIVHGTTMVIAVVMYFLVALTNPGRYAPLSQKQQKQQQKTNKQGKMQNLQQDLNKIEEETEKQNSLDSKDSKQFDKNDKKIDLNEKQRTQQCEKPEINDQYYLGLESQLKNQNQNHEKDIQQNQGRRKSIENGQIFKEIDEKLFSDIQNLDGESKPSQKCNNYSNQTSNRTNTQQKTLFADLEVDLAQQDLIPTNMSIGTNQNKMQPQVQRRLNLAHRFCRICQINQPLRVRHCHQCQSCILSFDHHCPWMSNCIGQKNKHFFLIYLLAQCLQLFFLTIDLIRFLVLDSQSPELANMLTQLSVFLLSVIFFTVVMTILMIFQLYFFSININTWEFMRWERIEYLQLFDRKLLKSLFNQGFVNNCKSTFAAARLKEPKQWESEISPNATNCLLSLSSPPQQAAKQPDSNRRLVQSHKQFAMHQADEN